MFVEKPGGNLRLIHSAHCFSELCLVSWSWLELHVTRCFGRGPVLFMYHVQQYHCLLTGLADLLEALYIITGNQVNFGYLERSTNNKCEYVTQRIA